LEGRDVARLGLLGLDQDVVEEPGQVLLVLPGEGGEEGLHAVQGGGHLG